ncbi:MAG: N-acetyl-gamma-glutamyl-phosphate reductase [Deltaproteobacteria bacterium]|jgi:N-acetyl-gamma-glutamyl-phosphate reductase|nr:N-acetyl-gamma-glutamyl-phosphate reductase [Deltaproteobacteria bacterium]
MIKAGLVGVTGYTGMELARLLSLHPEMELDCVTSRADAGKLVEDIYPFLRGFKSGKVVISFPETRELAERCSVVFLAVPHGSAMEMAGPLLDSSVKVVDLSADFRLRSTAVYEEWYGLKHNQAKALSKAVYGLPELYAPEIREAELVANPGCYPTAGILGLYPALKNSLIETEDIVIDAKSGATGAGRKASVSTLFCEVQDTFKPYGLPRHRHTPEIEQELSAIAGQKMTVSFNPHLLPVNRGILATIYTKPRCGQAAETIHKIYAETYARHRFVRVLPPGCLPELRNVRGTMFCDIALVPDERTGRLIILSVIDNLCRGASGQAVANANLMHGLPVETGLEFAPLAV